MLYEDESNVVNVVTWWFVTLVGAVFFIVWLFLHDFILVIGALTPVIRYTLFPITRTLELRIPMDIDQGIPMTVVINHLSGPSPYTLRLVRWIIALLHGLRALITVGARLYWIDTHLVFEGAYHNDSFEDEARQDDEDLDLIIDNLKCDMPTLLAQAKNDNARHQDDE